jgi:CSLREA domain-containing protein
MEKKSLITQLFLVSVVVIFAASFAPTSANANGDYIKVNTRDDNDDGVCDDNHCSLREAINHSNDTPGTQTIIFDIPDTGTYAIIQLCSPLPDILDPVVIDGTKPPGSNGPPMVVIKPWDPNNLPSCPCNPPPYGFWIEADGVIIRGVSMVGFFSFQAVVSGAIIVDNAVNTLIENNHLGVYPAGYIEGNYNAVLIRDDQTTVRNNVISGNWYGIHVQADDTVIQGNYIGTDIAGATTSQSLGNQTGVFLTMMSHSSTVGGFHPTQMNLISGNSIGIDVCEGGNTIVGNRIGTDLSGNLDLGNSNGILVTSSNNTIAGNLISGNSLELSFGTAGDGNIVQDNKIGTDISGNQPLVNATFNYHGIVISGQHNIIGGLNPGEGNLIAYHIHEGIEFSMDASENRVGGNTIWNNDTGVLIKSDQWDTALRNTLTQNSIFANSSLGIDLEPAGVSLNDPGDTDDGGNTVLNFPVLNTGANGVGGTACAGCTIELFNSDDDPSGYGEGETFIDSTVADSNGDFMFDMNLPFSQCSRFTATATDSQGNTSEFSENVEFGFCTPFSPSVILVPLFTLGLSLAIGALLARKPNINGRTALGVAGFAGLGLAGVLFVIMRGPSELPPQGPEESEVGSKLPSCSDYIDPDSLTPPEGAVFDLEDNPEFSWSPLDNLPPGAIHWTIELSRLPDPAVSLTTSEKLLAFSAFELQPEPGDIFKWRLSGETKESNDDVWSFFCAPTDWLPFQFQPPSIPAEPSDTPEPSPTPTPTPTPTPEMCVYTAIQNANCRSSDYSESEQINILMQGESTELLALNPEYTHGQFELDQELCWIWLGLLDGPENPFGTCNVPIIDPAPACTPELDEEACILAGGQMSETRTTAPICICPE